MANIKQQRKRVKIARRERLENLRYKSRIKTMFKSLAVAAEEDKDKAQQQALELISLIDRAASRGVLHANSAAHKKSRVTAMVELAEGVSRPAGPATVTAKSGESKAESRSGRNAAKRTKKEETKKKQAARAEAAEAAEAEAKKQEKEAAAVAEEKAKAEAAAAKEATGEEPAAEEPAAEEPAANEAPAEAAEESGESTE